jgi:hypothetical protein
VVQGEVSQAALGTELPQMLEGILNRPQATQEVSVVISDFIYGPARKSDFSQLPNLIRTSIAPVSQQQLAVAVFGEASRFYGTYHPAVKTPVAKRSLNGEKVPYYVWVIGPPELVARYAAEVFKNAPAQQAFYGLKLPTPAFAPLLTKLTDPKLKPSGGTVFAEGSGLSVDVSDDPVDFSLGLNLGTLPAGHAAAGISGPTSASAPAQRPGQPAAQLGAPAQRRRAGRAAPAGPLHPCAAAAGEQAGRAHRHAQPGLARPGNAGLGEKLVNYQ